jgi:Core-2/I-Branching enzyme
MRMAYLILAHDAPGQLAALIERLVPEGSPDVAIVHADARSALWLRLREELPSDTDALRLIRDPVAVRWGHWSLVAATLKLIEAALAAGCDQAHLMSGADWPAVPRDGILADIAREPDACRIEAIAGVQGERMQTWRLDSRWLRLDPGRNPLAYPAAWRLRQVSEKLDRARDRLGLGRSQPWGEWRKGSQWWSLPAGMLEVLAADLRGLIASGRLAGTLCADEHAIQTIVAARYPGRLAPNRRFVCWSEDLSSPRLLVAQDLPAIAASGAWFMRKVSAEHDRFFLDPAGPGSFDSSGKDVA